jgi:hypothetical protein
MNLIFDQISAHSKYIKVETINKYLLKTGILSNV